MIHYWEIGENWGHCRQLSINDNDVRWPIYISVQAEPVFVEILLPPDLLGAMNVMMCIQIDVVRRNVYTHDMILSSTPHTHHDQDERHSRPYPILTKERHTSKKNQKDKWTYHAVAYIAKT